MDKQGHIIVTGTGANGTTFLMDVFTEMGLDTRFPPGHESFEWHDPHADPLPKIIKRPQFCEDLHCWLDSGLIVDHAVILLRNLKEAAQSRQTVYKMRGPAAAGSLFGTTRPEEQEMALVRLLGQLLSTLAKGNVRNSFLDFEGINNTGYLCDRLTAIFADSDVAFDATRFKEAHDRALPRRKSRSKVLHHNAT